MLESELKYKFTKALIDPPGDNLDVCSNVLVKLDHYVYRCGLGAVMVQKI